MCTSKSQKRRWLYFLGIAIILFALILLWFDRTIASQWIINPRSITSYTKEELVNLYWENKDELNEVAEIVLANDGLKQRIIDNHDDYGEIRFMSDKGYFPEEEWNKIVALYKKIRCNEIVRLIWGGKDGVVYVDWRSKKTDGHEIYTALYYFKDVNTMEFYKQHYMGTIGQFVLEQIDGGWYVYENII